MHGPNARWAGCLLGLWLLASKAGAATGDKLFAQGVGAFRSGDYASALHYFEQARAAGLDLPTLYYNLGASLYKLGRYAEAEAAFAACARDPVWTALANYNAGLSAYQRGQHAAATAYFDRAWRVADSDEVRALALTMLSRTDVAAAGRPRGALTVDIGYNDNVTLNADNQTLQTSSEPDRFSELLASATGWWGQNARGLRWNAALYDLRYANLHDNNITSVALDVSHPTKVATWYTDAGARWEYVLRDGQRFQQIASLQLAGVHDLPNHADLRLSLRVSRVDALDDDFAFLDGSRQAFGLSTGHRLAGGRMRFGATLEHNDRTDLATTDEFFSSSPLRRELWWVGSWVLGGYWQLEPIARYARSRYADPDRRASGVIATREDAERDLSLRATYLLSAAWRALGEVSYVDNHSNFPEFSYSQRIVWLGVMRRF
jgi:tetratricopeptide (TPR) repeat protein